MTVHLGNPPQPVAFIPPPNCIRCGRFVSVDTAILHIEHGDYGTFHSVEFECSSHDAPREERAE